MDNGNKSELHSVSSRLHGVTQRLELIRNLTDAVIPDQEDSNVVAHRSKGLEPVKEQATQASPPADPSNHSAEGDRPLDIRLRGYIAGLNGDLRRGRGKILDWVNGLRPAPGFDFDEVNYRRLAKQAAQVRVAADRARRDIGRLWFTNSPEAGAQGQVDASR